MSAVLETKRLVLKPISLSVLVMPGNEGAYRFWRKIISDYTHGNFKEYTRTVNQYNRNIFELKSQDFT